MATLEKANRQLMLQELFCGLNMHQDRLLFSTTLHTPITCYHRPIISIQACLAAPPTSYPLKIPEGCEDGVGMDLLDAGGTLGTTLGKTQGRTWGRTFGKIPGKDSTGQTPMQSRAIITAQCMKVTLIIPSQCTIKSTQNQIRGNLTSSLLVEVRLL